MPRRTIQDVAFENLCACRDLRGTEVLEVGSCEDELALRLAERGASVTALDIYPVDDRPGVRHVRHDLDGGPLPFADETFDAVVSTEVLEHLRAPFLALSEVVRVLRTGGHLVLTVPNYWNLRYRLRYLFTGGFQRPVVDQPIARQAYGLGLTPHVNSIPYAVLRTILTWEGCGDFRVARRNLFPWYRLIAYAPILAAIRLSMLLGGRERRASLFLDDANGASALLGARHVLLRCTKQGKTIRVPPAVPPVRADIRALEPDRAHLGT
jgi:SAM-dependent methyltransferase